MDRDFVQAKTSRSRSVSASGIGNGRMKLAIRRKLCVGPQWRLPMPTQTRGARNDLCSWTLFKSVVRSGLWSVRCTPMACCSAIAFPAHKPINKFLRRSNYR